VAASQPASVTGTSTPTPSQDVPSYKELLEFQEKNNQHLLEVQREVSERAIQAATQQAQAILTTAQIGAFLVLVISTFVGWRVKREFSNFVNLRKQSEKFLSEVKTKLSEIDDIQNRFSSKIEELSGTVKPLESIIPKYTLELEQFGETIEDIKIKARVAQLGFDLFSNNFDDRLRAAQAASEMAKGERGAVALPLLLGCLRKSDEPPEVIAEALYGLSHRGRDIIGDDDALNLILVASRSDENVVRIEALKTMKKVGLNHNNFHQRIRECYDTDKDDRVKEVAGQILTDENLL
jgi:hypothetical protein